MTPNNLHGHVKNIKWGVLYEEELDSTWKLIITLSKEYSGEHFPHVCLKCIVTNGSQQIFSNGTITYNEHIAGYWYELEKAPPLLTFTTKDGFICEQFVASKTSDKIRYDWKTNITPEFLLEKSTSKQ